MRATNDPLMPGTLVEIRNPFMNDKGVRYDQRVLRGVIVETRPGGLLRPRIHYYKIMVEGQLELYTTSVWDITPLTT
jgi:hypothetical protein